MLSHFRSQRLRNRGNFLSHRTKNAKVRTDFADIFQIVGEDFLTMMGGKVRKHLMRIRKMYTGKIRMNLA